jgi:peptide subunit release factor 1 (eRF1)
MDVEAIQQLSKVESAVKGTSLITLYLPAGGNL